RPALRLEDVTPLREAPAVIGPLPDQVNLLPEVLTVLADPELARLRVVAEPPRVAQAVGPQLGPGVGPCDERAVLRHRVVPTGVGVVDVEPQDGPEEVVERLAGEVGVGVAGAVAGGDVKVAVVTEGEVAPVVAVGRPLDDEDFRSGVDAVRGAAVDR